MRSTDNVHIAGHLSNGVLFARYRVRKNGEFTLVLSSALPETANVSIRSMDNKLVYVQENIKVLGVNTLSINLESVAQGTYLIQIKCGSGELKDKIVIKK